MWLPSQPKPLLPLLLLLLLRPGAVDSNNSVCTDAHGVSAPCGPGNDQCNASQPPPKSRFHVKDYS
eukprot:SAG11_NODE_13301_length_661_cov_0.916370_1_plen_65_part_01